MKGKSLSKKAIITILIIAILLIVAISMVVVFLKDQGKTEATAISENNSNSSQTEQAVQEENRREETNQPANEENAEAEVEQTEEITDNSQNVQTNVGTQQAQTTTTADADSQTTTIDTTVTVPTEEVNLGWSNVTVSGGELLANIDANVTDVTAPIRLATNILKNGESNDLKEYYVKRKDEILMYIAVNEELVHNPTFTLINDGKEYIMEDSLVTVRQDNETRWVYTVIYKIPENTTFVDGEITLKISNIEDKAGNKLPDENGPTNGHRVFYDGTLPEIHVKGTEGYIEEKENYVGNSEKNIYSKVSFKLKDNYKVVEYEVNDTLIKITPNSWTDANYANIKTYLVEGENTIIVRDIAGNEATYKFTYDSIAPVYSKLGILNKTRYVNNVKDLTWAKEGDEVRILISFPEKLAIEPKVEIFGKEYTATYRPLSSSPEKNSYYYMVDFKLDKTMPEGEIPFEISGYADEAKNVGEKLNNANINHDQYTKVVYDLTAPEIIVKEESKGTDPYFSNVSFKLHDNYLVKEYEINENVVEVTPNAWTDANFQNIKQYLVAGENTIIVRDMAGNATTRTFIYDTVAPEITVKEESKGTDPYFSNVSFKLHDNYLVKEYEINGKIMKVTPNAWTDANFQNIKQYLVAGENTIIVRDMAGNATTKTFVYDTVAPEYSAMGIFKWTNNKDGEDVKIATKNEHIRLFVAFPEMLQINPKVDIYGENGVTTTKELEYSEAAKFYFVEFDTTEELKLPQGKISYKVYGYEDIAGNVGKDLTEKDTTDIRYPEVIYDSVAPKYIKLGIARNKNTTDLREQEYAKVGDSVRVLISFPESLAVEPKVKMFDKEYDVTYRPDSSNVNANIYYYMADIEITEDMPEGEITFEIYGYEDIAGNVGERLANQNINNELYTKVIIDNTAPKATVTFSNKNGAELTNQDVLATLTADEAIQNIEGWTRIDDRTFTKIYSVNGKYSVEIADLTGNTSVIRYEVKRIDKTAPEATVTFSNDNGATMTNQDVTVTLKANETIRDIEGWTRVNDRTFTKVYSENGKYSVEIIDKVGNTSTIKFEVKRIDKTAPVITLPTKNTFEVGVDIYTYPEAGSVYDESDKEISFSKVNIAWFKATANGEKGERVDSFEWNTSLKNRDLGTYYIEYWVADKAGNVGRAHRLLTLQDTTKPTIILNGENKQEIELGTGTYLEQGATVTDNRDEKVENIEPYKIDWYSQNGLQEFNVSKVDINKAGQYNVFYQYTDKAGNYSQIIRKVFVIDSNELELSEPKYTTLDNGNILVTIKANKLIKNIDGWKLSEDGKEISKEYKKIQII